MNALSSKYPRGTDEANQVKRRPITGWLLILLHVLLAIGALLGGGAFLLAPDGHLIQMPISQLKNSPFSNFLIPGALLFTFLGIFPLAVAYSMWKRPTWRWSESLNPFKQFHWVWAGSLAVGVIAIVWIGVQIMMIQFGAVHVLYLVWGVVLVLLTLHPGVRQYYYRT